MLFPGQKVNLDTGFEFIFTFGSFSDRYTIGYCPVVADASFEAVVLFSELVTLGIVAGAAGDGISWVNVVESFDVVLVIGIIEEVVV